MGVRHARQPLIRCPTLRGLHAGLTQGNLGLIRAYVRPSCAAIAFPFATHSEFGKRRLQKTDHRLHVTHTKVCMFKSDSHCATIFQQLASTRGDVLE